MTTISGSWGDFYHTSKLYAEPLQFREFKNDTLLINRTIHKKSTQSRLDKLDVV